MQSRTEVLPAAPMVSATGVFKRFGALEVLRGVDLTVARGEVVAVLGASGSGKSTLLRCLNHLETVDRGTIRIAGDTLVADDEQGRARYPAESEVRRVCRHTGMVFQHFNLFPHMNALKNVMEGLTTVLRLPKTEAEARATALLQKVGLAERAHMMPDQLSGGQKQRVAIARALAMQPSVMLFDEATSALDPELVGEVLQVIQSLAKDGMTMILVTHEIAFAREVADKVVFMRDGVVVEEGPPAQVIDNPREEATRSFLGRIIGHTA